ncbi:MAG: hypothetical protein HY322_10015 [Betaproteobacteria bacterium]|nr:hypothetical protein [Betaproteobacteria bacterium]
MTRELAAFVANLKYDDIPIDVPRGSARNPLTWDDVVAKFKPLVRGSIAGEDQIRVIDAVANIEAMDGAAFMRVMATALESKSRTPEIRRVAAAAAAL